MKKTDIKQREQYAELDQRIRKMQKESGSFATKEEVSAGQEEIKQQVDVLSAETAEFKKTSTIWMEAYRAKVNVLEAEDVIIRDTLQASNATIAKLEAGTAEFQKTTTTTLEAYNGEITNLKAKNLEIDGELTAQRLSLSELSAQQAKFESATAENFTAVNANISNLSGEVADFKETTTETLTANSGDIEKLKAKDVEIANLLATKATIDQLNAVDGKIDNLSSKAITTDNLSAKVADLGYATAENLNAANANIQKLQTDKLDASTADLKYATISNLEAAVGRIGTLEANSLTAGSAVITELQAGIAELDTLIFGSASGTSIHTSFANAVIAQLGNAQIKSAMIDTISADKITSGSINTNNVSIQSNDGSMVISDNTIQIKDGNTVRVQIGKDGADDYSISVWDSGGNLVFSEGGITENAIKSAIIRNDMVAANANISAGKLDIDSLFTEINNSTNTIKSTKIYLDDKNQTLDVVFEEMETSVSQMGETLTSHGTSISTIQGQITSKIWQQDIDTAKSELSGDIETLSTQYSTLNQTVSGLNSTVASHTSLIASKADKSTVTTISNNVATLEQNLEGFKTTVSDTYQTKDDMANYSTTSQMNSAIEQKADSITQTVSENYATKEALAKTDRNVSSITSRVAANETKISQNTQAIELRATKTEMEESYSKSVSRGEQLVTNGSGLMGDNTNFSSWTFDGAVANNSPGSFTVAQGTKKTAITDEFFPLSTNNEYTFSLDAKTLYGLSRMYSMLVFYDADKNQITAGHHMHNAASTTTLAQDLKAGDTVIYLTDASGWSTTYSYGFYMTVWNYTNSFGYTYPVGTYSRKRITLPKTSANKLDSNCLDTTANTITLATAYSGATIPAGTSVSQGADGNTYKYFPLSNTLIGTEWETYSGKIAGVDYSGTNKAKMFPPGTAYAKVGFLWNYNTADDQTWVTNIVVTDTTAVSAAQETADSVKNNLAANYYTKTETEAKIKVSADAITAEVEEVKTDLSGNYAKKTEVTQTASDLTVKITAAQETADSAASAASSAQSTANSVKTDLANNYTKKTIPDTRSDNQTPAWYQTNYPKQIITEFKYCSTIGLSGTGETYCTLTTTVPWSDSSGGRAKQTAKAGGKEYWRYGTSDTAWSAWIDASKTATNYLNFSSSGLVVGDMTASTLGKNVLIDSDSVDIRSGTTVLASFGSSVIELGSVSTISKISLLNGVGVIEAVDLSGAGVSDSLEISLNDNEAERSTYLQLNAEYSKLRAKAITIDSGSEGLILSAGYGEASLYLISAWASVDVPFVYMGNPYGVYSSQASVPYLKWVSINSKNPYIGYATDQTDGTFVVASILGTNYASGLAIGGGSGNLLYKGAKVPTLSDIATTSTAGVMSANDKMKLNQTNVAYGVCATEAATAAKTVAISGNTKWTLTIGSIICIEFYYTNTASNPTLNVNGTGAKNIYYGTSQITTSNLSYAGYASRKMMFMYDGTGYWFMGWSYDANTNTQLRVYRQDGSSYNGDYPLIASRTKAASLGTVGTESSYEGVYGLISDTNANIPTVNPYSGMVKLHSLTVNNDMTLTGAMYMSNSQRIYQADVNGTNREILRLNSGSTPTLIIGDGLYTAGIGITNISAGTEVKLLTSNNRVILTNVSSGSYNATFKPYTNNTCALGDPTYKWYAVYAVNGTIQTSDRREKENIMPIGTEQMMFTTEGTKIVDLHSELFDRLKPVQYNFINGNKKISYGLIAQDVIEAMHEIGIDENSLDLVHHDFYTDTDTGEEKETYGLGYNNLIALLIHEVQKLKFVINQLKGEQAC